MENTKDMMGKQLKEFIIARCDSLAPNKWDQGRVVFDHQTTLVTRGGGIGYWDVERCGIRIHVDVENEDKWIGWRMVAELLDIHMR